VPMALGLSRGSEANVPLGRAVLGGLLAGLATTLFVVPKSIPTLIGCPRLRSGKCPDAGANGLGPAGAAYSYNRTAPRGK